MRGGRGSTDMLGLTWSRSSGFDSRSVRATARTQVSLGPRHVLSIEVDACFTLSCGALVVHNFVLFKFEF